MKENVLNAVYDLVDEIKGKKEYIRFLELKKIMDTDESVKEIIKAFSKAKEKYSEVSKYGKYHPDLQDVRIELVKTKEAVFSNNIISEYKQLEKDIQKILDNISREIAVSVSPKIKHPNEIGLINKI